MALKLGKSQICQLIKGPGEEISMEQMSESILRILKSPWIQRLLRIIIGAIFIYASFDKIVHPDRVAEIIMDYEILPWGLINISAIWLPFLELLVGVLVIGGIWVRSCSFLLMGLCVLFIGGISYSLVRSISLHCGCFSTSSSGATRTWGSLWQEGLLLLGCVWLWVMTLRRDYNYAN
jgi:uncharacterized membrane protein YphA (DoxX/SURF4 family)